jgi:hypothetical protein
LWLAGWGCLLGDYLIVMKRTLRTAIFVQVESDQMSAFFLSTFHNYVSHLMAITSILKIFWGEEM